MSTNFEEAYKKLNLAQKSAVDTIDGPVLVVAGPGTGKTQLLATRVANILLKTDTLPSSILCLTFTDAAAKNMRARLVSLIGREAYKVSIHTFHSFSTEIINHYPQYFFFGAKFVPADNISKFQILFQIFESMKWDNPLKSYHPELQYVFLNDAKDAIAAMKKAGITPDKFNQILDTNEEVILHLNPIFDSWLSTKVSNKHLAQLPDILLQIESVQSKTTQPEINLPSFLDVIKTELEILIKNTAQFEKPVSLLSEFKKRFLEKDINNKLVLKDTSNIPKHRALAELYKSYQEEMYKQGLYDFEDMLLEVVKVLENPDYADLKYNLQEQYQYFLVDEFQDTNGVQMRLLGYLLDSAVADGNPNILTVGDDDQSIFKFQGASLDNLLQFKKIYSQAKIINLVENYRSKQKILNFSNKLIEQSEVRLSQILDLDKTLISRLPSHLQ